MGGGGYVFMLTQHQFVLIFTITEHACVWLHVCLFFI